jgi:hypothetical protein
VSWLDVRRHWTIRRRRVVGWTATAGLLALGILVPGAGGQPTARAVASGRVIAFDGRALTIQTPGRPGGLINALTAAAAQLNHQDYSYVWGGGHAAAGVPSIGARGPGYNGHRIGYDCSGAVAAVLSRAGLWTPGGWVPDDAGIISTLRREGIIVPGVGRGPLQVTFYDDPGVHIFMNIDGRFWGTSDGDGPPAQQSRGGAGWIDDPATDSVSGRFRRYHIVPSLLRVGRGVGYSVTALLGAQSGPITSFASGDQVRLSFANSGNGANAVTAVQLRGARTLTGTVSQLGPTGAWALITPPSGPPVKVGVLRDSLVLTRLQVGDGVALTVVPRGNWLIVRGATVTSPPPTSSSTSSSTTTTTSLPAPVTTSETTTVPASTSSSSTSSTSTSTTSTSTSTSASTSVSTTTTSSTTTVPPPGTP